MFPEKYGNPNAVTNLICGAIAGMLGQSSSYPLDIVRRRMQTSGITGEQYNTIIGTLTKVYRLAIIKKNILFFIFFFLLKFLV
jgi:solute carrier family 25 protein 42